MNEENNRMHLLGIESSGLTSAISLSENHQLLGQISINIKNSHSRVLAKMTDQILNQCGLAYSNLSGIAISAGPGSFTGLRIGYSLAKGLAHSINIPIVQIPTLDIWAFQEGKSTIPILAFIDAHRQEIYCGKYHWQEHQFQSDGDYQLLPLNSLPDIISEPTLITGSDAIKFKSQIRKSCGELAVFPFPFKSEPQSWAFLHLAYKKFTLNETSNAENCEPLYLRAFKGVM